MSDHDFKLEIADKANESLEHPYVLQALDALIREFGASNLRGHSYLVLKDLMSYVAIISRATALGIDPEMIRREALIPKQLQDQISRANRESVPLFLIQKEENTYDA